MSLFYVYLNFLPVLCYASLQSPEMTMIVGVENPLLDISVNCDDDLLAKYSLDPNAAILAGPEHLPLLEEIKSFDDVFYSAGGATQNAMRTAQWILGGKESVSRVAYMGCVGKDDNMAKMKWSVEDVFGVRAVYQIDETHPTGTCGVLISSHGKNRSLVANLGAANHFQKRHLEANRAEILNKARIIYSSGFFITAATESLDYLAEYVATEATKPIFCFNLAAPFICEVEPFRIVLMRTITYVDYLFGNDAEADALAKALGWNDIAGNLKAIAQRIADLEKKGVSAKRNRVVIITQGSEDTIVAIQGESEPRMFPIQKIPESEIIDSNGCGDAYAGAFVAGLLENKTLDECCRAGAYAAYEIIRRSGCTLPDKPEFSWK
jgi:adenosine kinase